MYCNYCCNYYSFEEVCNNKYCKELKELIKKLGIENIIKKLSSIEDEYHCSEENNFNLTLEEKKYYYNIK